MERGYTTFDEHNIVYEWKIDKIDHFLNQFNENDPFTFISEKFSTGAKINDEWHIRLDIFNAHPNRVPKKYSNMSFTLCCLSNTSNINIKSSSYILNKEKNKVLEISGNRYCLLSKDETETFYVNHKNLMANKDEYISNNTLTFCLHLTVYDTPVSTSTKLELKIPKRQMVHDYTELFDTKMGYDVIVNVSSKEFQAHRTILMARSPVLAAMFSHEMAEKKENKISIPDITPEIFEIVLKYIYTDKVTGLDDVADDLLEAADKYQIQSLKEICEESLCKTLTVDNALTIMTLADRHSAKHLLEFTNKFVASNIERVVKTQNFKEFIKANSPSVNEFLEKFRLFN